MRRLTTLATLATLAALLTITTAGLAQDNAPYGDGAWTEEVVSDQGTDTMDARGRQQSADLISLDDDDSLATCYPDQTNSTTPTEFDDDPTSIMFGITNDTGANWTLREAVDNLANDFTGCSVAEGTAGEFMIVYQGGTAANNLEFLNATVTEDWGKTWTSRVVARDVDGFDDWYVVHDTGGTWQMVGNNRSGSGSIDIITCTQDCDATTTTTFIGSAQGRYHRIDAADDIWSFTDSADTSVVCQATHFDGSSADVIAPLPASKLTGSAISPDQTCNGWVNDAGDIWVSVITDAGTTNAIEIFRNRSDEQSFSKMNQIDQEDAQNVAGYDFLETLEGLFIANTQEGGGIQICESDDGFNTVGCDDGVTGADKTHTAVLATVDTSKPGLLTAEDSGGNTVVGFWFYWPEGGETVLPFTEIFPEADVTADFQRATGVEVNYQLATPSVWVRDRHEAPTPNKLYRFNVSLIEQHRASYCEDAGLLNARSQDGLGITLDNLPIATCRRSGDAAPVVVLTDVFGDVTNEYATKTDTIPVAIEATTGNRVAWVPSLLDQVEEADIPGQDSVIRNKFTSSVDIDINSTNWITHTGDGGTFTFTELGSNQRASATAETWESVQAFQKQLWGWDNDANELTRYAISGGGYVAQATKTLSTDQLHALEISPDGQFLLAREGTDRVALLNATSLGTLAKTKVIPDLQDAAIDGCNNHIFTVNNTHLARFDIGNFTSCEGFGGTDGDQINQPPSSEPIGDDTDEQTDPNPPETDADGDTFGGFARSNAAAAFDVSEGQAGWILGALIILGLGGGFWAATKSGQAAWAGAIGGAAIGTGLTWIPVWFLLTVAIISLALLVFVWRR